MAPPLNGVFAIIGGGLISDFFPCIHVWQCSWDTAVHNYYDVNLMHAASIVELVSISLDLAWPVVSLLWTLIGASHQIHLQLNENTVSVDNNLFFSFFLYDL